MRGPQLLKDWIERRGYNQREAADLLGIHQTMVTFLIKGHRRPPLEMAIDIERATGIPVEAWVSSSDDNSRSMAAAESR